MSRRKNFRYKPGERDHITIVGESSPGNQIHECGICKAQWPPPSGFKGRSRFAFQYWMKEHIKCNTEPRYGEVRECPVPEQRGIDDSMPKAQHMLDRQVRHFPYEVGDGRDYGRKQERKSWKRRQRQTDRAISDEWPTQRKT
jgi:hypothetical protein